MNLEKKYYSNMNSMNVTEEDEVGYCNKRYSKVESAESYAALMGKAGIEIDIEERRNHIFRQSAALAESAKGQIVVNGGLLNEVVNLVEAPVPILGEFNESFLELPKDLLTMVMQKHQKYFSIADHSGRLLPYFIAVRSSLKYSNLFRL
ncbi:glycine--tRNA ligase, chloroplastic/mitochondrial 2-like [Eucalyptus grandis]|uniref:glycine--tRNA ligase, chloroplastic/mitochondrial 2-like n=1 Tax=Eucalyptus grandis TaxID=71139 RepID=UPI00192F0A19|nr:glycine--tRNA ligase, chloroplastic/mitochondrial 2-like [Eucalyptus grandis]